MPQVVVGLDQFLFQMGQEWGMDGRIIRADVVRLVNDPAAEQLGPDTIHDVASKPRIIRADQPIGENHTGDTSRVHRIRTNG
jgi:hypothetical protein